MIKISFSVISLLMLTAANGKFSESAFAQKPEFFWCFRGYRKRLMEENGSKTLQAIFHNIW